MKRGHLQRRGTRGRSIAWARIPDVRNGIQTGVQYRVFLRLSTGATQAELRCFDFTTLSCEAMPVRAVIARELRAARAQLRWARDQIEFQLLGLEDPTPRPVTA